MLELALNEMELGELTGAVVPKNPPPDWSSFSVGPAQPGSKNSIIFRVPAPTPEQPRSVAWFSLKTNLRTVRLYLVNDDGHERFVEEKV